MVHLSDLDWTRAGDEVIKDYKKGDTVKAVVLDVDSQKERISLGIKQLSGDPIDALGQVQEGRHRDLHGRGRSGERHRGQDRRQRSHRLRQALRPLARPLRAAPRPLQCRRQGRRGRHQRRQGGAPHHASPSRRWRSPRRSRRWRNTARRTRAPRSATSSRPPSRSARRPTTLPTTDADADESADGEEREKGIARGPSGARHDARSARRGIPAAPTFRRGLLHHDYCRPRNLA